jgi:hypothetical protein
MGAKGVRAVQEGKVAAKYAGYQEGRKQQFHRLALASRLRKQDAAHANRMMGVKESYLSSQEKMFPYMMGMQALGSGLSWWEGRKRASAMAEDRRKRQYMINRINQRTEALESGIPFQYLYGPGGK